MVGIKVRTRVGLGSGLELGLGSGLGFRPDPILMFPVLTGNRDIDCNNCNINIVVLSAFCQ